MLTPIDPQDFYVIDGLEPILIEHHLSVRETHGIERQIDYDKMTVHVQKQEIRTFGKFLGTASREQNTVRQVFQRGVSITQDNLPLSDSVIEVASETNELIPKSIRLTTGDVITNLLTNEKWSVAATDLIGFKSRWRLACRRLS